jgi:hypothetical protein
MEIILAPFLAPLAFLPMTGLVWTAFWIWMLVDAVLRDDHEYPGEWEYRKVAWVLAIVFVHAVAVVYLFLVFLKVRRGARTPSVSAPAEYERAGA